jgi:hypothetical protein
VALRSEFERVLAEILATARAAGRRQAEWGAIRSAWTPGAGTVPLAGGAAHPSEVREVLLAVQRVFAARADEPAHAASDPDDDLWELRHRRLPAFVREELDRYVADVAPRPSIADVFGRAARQAQLEGAPPAAADPSVRVITCTRCGAPRQTDNLYGECAHCGAPFFPRSGS